MVGKTLIGPGGRIVVNPRSVVKSEDCACCSSNTVPFCLAGDTFNLPIPTNVGDTIEMDDVRVTSLENHFSNLLVNTVELRDFRIRRELNPEPLLDSVSVSWNWYTNGTFEKNGPTIRGSLVNLGENVPTVDVNYRMWPGANFSSILGETIGELECGINDNGFNTFCTGNSLNFPGPQTITGGGFGDTIELSSIGPLTGSQYASVASSTFTISDLEITNQNTTNLINCGLAENGVGIRQTSSQSGVTILIPEEDSGTQIEVPNGVGTSFDVEFTCQLVFGRLFTKRFVYKTDALTFSDTTKATPDGWSYGCDFGRIRVTSGYRMTVSNWTVEYT